MGMIWVSKSNILIIGTVQEGPSLLVIFDYNKLEVITVPLCPQSLNLTQVSFVDWFVWKVDVENKKAKTMN